MTSDHVDDLEAILDQDLVRPDRAGTLCLAAVISFYLAQEGAHPSIGGETHENVESSGRVAATLHSREAGVDLCFDKEAAGIDNSAERSTGRLEALLLLSIEGHFSG